MTAGKDLAVPLTFGDLWTAPGMQGEPPMTGPTIKLQVVPTNLTLGRPFTIPFESYAFYFDEKEFTKLFPASVVQYMRVGEVSGHRGTGWPNRFRGRGGRTGDRGKHWRARSFAPLNGSS
jgi:hypothetical protein